MEGLICGTAAYKILAGDRGAGKLSHAYMLYYRDAYTMRAALKIFALQIFGAEKNSRDGRLILSEGLADLKIYPMADKKLTADTAAEIVADAALRPLEHDKKLYVIEGFETASPIFQNKLLKILEEPPAGVCFLLGATSLSPVLDTVKSRVKLLEIPPFTAEQVCAVLDREKPDPRNMDAAKSCGGLLGVARNILHGEWYGEVRAAADQICACATVGAATGCALKYGDFKYKKELLAEMQRIYFDMFKNCAMGKSQALSLPALSYAVENLNSAFADLKFNANFGALLFDFLLKVVEQH